MIILVHTKFNSNTIPDSIGKSEYSYYFVLKKFLPVLREIGDVVVIENPAVEVEEYFNKASKEGRRCVFLSFTAPHNLYIDSKCPTIPVFAWEYDTIPNESWDGNEKNNWVKVLQNVGAAITHSGHSVKVVQKELGQDFPIIACPAPMDVKYFASQEEMLKKSPHNSYEITLTKEIIDTAEIKFGQLENPKGWSQRIELTHVLLQTWAHEVLEDALPKTLYHFLRNTYLLTGTSVARTLRYLRNLKPKNHRISNSKTGANLAPPSPSSTLVEGIIYTSVLNISDKRKNYEDMVAAFCFALKDKSDATLILKTPVMGHLYFYKEKVIGLLRNLPPFKCRVVVIGNYLDQEAYQNLMHVTTFYVNTSYGEGQCLPLMEYMAAGVPAIAPYATALRDYLTDSNAFLVKTGAAPTSWQHDERIAIRTVHHRPDWYSLVAAYQKSYQMAKNAEEMYRNMGLEASKTIKDHASFQKIKNSLEGFFNKKSAAEM